MILASIMFGLAVICALGVVNILDINPYGFMWYDWFVLAFWVVSAVACTLAGINLLVSAV